MSLMLYEMWWWKIIFCYNFGYEKGFKSKVSMSRLFIPYIQSQSTCVFLGNILSQNCTVELTRKEIDIKYKIYVSLVYVYVYYYIVKNRNITNKRLCLF